MADDNLNININAFGDDAAREILDVVARFEKLRDAMSAAADAGTQSTSKIVEGAGEVAEAVGATASAQATAADQMVGSIRNVSAAQQQQLDDLHARFAAELQAQTDLTNQEIALRIRWLDNERQMGRMSLEDEQSRLSEILSSTEANSAARIAAERAVQLVNAELVQQSIAEYRAEAEAGVISSEQQIKALQSIAAEAEYSLKTRMLASDEIARIEKMNAAEAAAAVTAAEREKRAEAAATAAEMKEEAYVAMDVGYALSSIGVKGGKTLADLSYLARDFSAAGAGMVLQMAGIGLAVAAVTETIGFLGKGIKDAEAEESQMATIRAAVEAEGASWEDARRSIEDYTTSLQANSTYSKGEALDAINQLIQRGLTYQQSEEAVSAAVDLAAAEHLKLSEAVKLLTSAEGSRAAALERYDPQLKALIDRHASLHDIVLQVSRDFDGDMVDALNTTEGTSEHLGHQMDELGVHFGNLVNGPLADLIGGLDAVVQGLNNAIDATQRFFSAQADASTIAGVGLDLDGDKKGAGPSDGGGFGEDAGDDMFARYSHTKSSPYDNPTGRQSASNDSHDISERISMVSELYRTNRMTYDEALRQEEELRTRYKLTNEQVNELTMAELRLQDERASKEKAGARAGEAAYKQRPVDVQLIGDPASKTDSVVAGQKILDSNLKDLTASEDSYRLAVDLATTSEQKATAEAQLRAKQQNDARVAEFELTAQIAAEIARRNELSGQEREATANATRLAAEHDALAQALNTTQDRSGALAARVADLQKQYTTANSTSTSLRSTIDTLTTQIDANTDSLKKHQLASAADEIAAAKLTLAYNDARDKAAESLSEEEGTFGVSLEREQTYWTARIAALDRGSTDYLAKLADFEAKLEGVGEKIRERDVTGAQKYGADAQSLADDEATYDRSLQQQLAYYAARYQQEVAANGQYSEQAEELAKKILSIEEDEYKQRIDAQKQFTQELQTGEETLVGDIIGKHETLRNTLHSIWTDMVNDFTKQIETMVVKGALLSSLNNEIAKMLGIGGSGAAGAAQSGATSGGLFGSFFGSSGATQIASSLPTTGGVTGLLFGPGAVTASGAQGGYTGAGSGSLTASQLDAYSSATAAPGSAFGSGGGVSVGGGSRALGSILGGAGYGGLAAGLDGGNETGGMLGGALGGALGLALNANPLIGAGIDLAAGLIGSLFGSHTNPSNNPDDYESQTGYGQDVADLQFGQSGANGSYYYPDASVAKFVAQMNVANGSITGGANQGMQSVNSNGTIASSGGIDAAEMWLSQNQNDTAAQLEQMGVSPAQFANWVKLFGESATGSGQYSHIAGDPNIGDIEVTGATRGGNTKTNYSSLATALQAIISASSNGTGAVPTFSVTRSYNDPSIVTGVESTGTYTPTPTNLLGVPAAGSSTSTAAGTNTAGTSTAGTNAVAEAPAVSVNIYGNVVGPSGMDSIAQEIGIALGRFQGGLVPGAGSGAGGRMQRFTGGS